MRPTSLRMMAALSAKLGLNMRRWNFVAAYLQGELEPGEITYCTMPTGYGIMGAGEQPRVRRVEKPIYGMSQAGRRWQRSPLPRSCKRSLPPSSRTGGGSPRRRSAW